MGRKLLDAFLETRTIWILGPILVGMTYIRFVWPF